MESGNARLDRHDDQKIRVGTSLAEMVGLHVIIRVVEVVSTGMEAIQAYDRHRPDVVPDGLPDARTQWHHRVVVIFWQRTRIRLVIF